MAALWTDEERLKMCGGKSFEKRLAEAKKLDWSETEEEDLPLEDLEARLLRELDNLKSLLDTKTGEEREAVEAQIKVIEEKMAG